MYKKRTKSAIAEKSGVLLASANFTGEGLSPVRSGA